MIKKMVRLEFPITGKGLHELADNVSLFQETGWEAKYGTVNTGKPGQVIIEMERNAE